MTTPEWGSNIRPGPLGTSIRYGNMETQPVEETSTSDPTHSQLYRIDTAQLLYVYTTSYPPAMSSHSPTTKP